MSQSSEPCRCWKTRTTTPNAAASESRFSTTALTREHDRAEGAREQDQRQQDHEGRARTGSCRRARARSRGRPRRSRRASRACPRALALTASMVRLDPGRRPVDGGERLDDRGVAASPGGGRRGADDARDRRAASRRSAAGSRAVLDEHVERLHDAGADAARSASSVAPGDRVAAAGERSSAAPRSRFSCVPSHGERARRSRGPTSAAGSGRRMTKRAQRPQRAVLRMPAVDQALRQHADAVDALAEHGQHRRQQRDRREHRDGRDQHARRCRSSG